jgi:hypothetical protein
MPLPTAMKKAIVVGIVIDGDLFSDASARGKRPIIMTRSHENPRRAPSKT